MNLRDGLGRALRRGPGRRTIPPRSATSSPSMRSTTRAPDTEPWRDRDGIVAGWLERKDEPGTWVFRYQVLAETADLAFVRGWTHYVEPPTDFSNLWVIRFDAAGRCVEFTEWWMEHGQQDAARAEGECMNAAEREALIDQYEDGFRAVSAALEAITDGGAGGARGAGRVEPARDRSPPGRQRDDLGYPAATADRGRRAGPLGYDQEAFVRNLYPDRPIEPSLAAFEAARAATAPILRRLSEEQWRRAGTHSESGSLLGRGLAAHLQWTCPRPRRPDPPRRATVAG